MFYVWSKWLNITFYNSLDIDNQMLQNDKNKKIKSSRCTIWGTSTLEMFTQSPMSAKEWERIFLFIQNNTHRYIK